MLDSNEHTSNHKWIAGIGCKEVCSANENSFDALEKFISKNKDWAFGYLTYDLKNEIEDLHSENHDGFGFPSLSFFVPEYVLIATNNGELQILYHDGSAESLLDKIRSFHRLSAYEINDITPKARVRKETYLEKVKALKDHIQLGDIYEVNFCQEFYAENVEANIGELYTQLNSISEAPFSVLLKIKNIQVACASPERFLKKEGTRVISQPIKGTRKRGTNETEDKQLIEELETDEKEFSENVMIVDLVRNDLSKTAAKGSVKVEELCKVYTYKQVHQLVSTISSKIKDGIGNIELIKSMFPMGSMTGAPKIRAMQLIEEYESMKRGIYSGTIGYFAPNGDFDLNVVIRSIVYNSENKFLSFCTGGAITSASIPEKEYEESMVKAKAMFNVLQNQNSDEFA